jgi:hypothetical protein
MHIGVDGLYDTRWISIEGEAAFNASRNGWGAFIRADTRPQRFTTVGFGVRDYRDMLNRMNLPPLYTGISGGNDTDELGWFASVDVAPWRVLSAGVDVDASRRHDGSDNKLDTMLRLQLNPASRITTLFTWEIENRGGRNPRIFTAMANYRLGGGSRFSARYSRDTVSESPMDTVQLSAQYPVLDSRLTLLAEHALRRMDGKLENTPQLGCTLRIWSGNFVTLRYSMDAHAPNSISATVFSRY